MFPEKQRRTFISYSRINKEFALKLALELRSSGFNVWLDQLDIPPGARWDDAVEQALEDCEIFLVVLTPASSTSNNVKDEIGYAIDTGKRILPVLLKNAKVPLRLRRFQYVDFTAKSDDEGIESAKILLKKLIEEPTIPRNQSPVVAKAQKANVDHNAKEETEGSTKQKVEEEHLTKESLVAEQLTAQQTELDRKVKEKANIDHIAQVRRETEAEQLAQAKNETEHKAKEEADHLASQKAEEERLTEIKLEPASSAIKKPGTESILKTERKPTTIPMMIGIFAVVALVACGVGGVFLYRAMSAPGPTNTLISMPIVLSADEANQLLDNTSVKGFYSLAKEQYTDAQLKDFSDNNQPIPLTLTASIPLQLGYVYCAKTQAILVDNEHSIDYAFEFMGNTIPKSNYGSHDFTADNGDACRLTYIIIDKWTTGQYNVYQKFDQTQKINDGYSDIDPYTDWQKYVVTVP